MTDPIDPPVPDPEDPDMTPTAPPPDFDYGFGAIQSPPDMRDRQMADLYAEAGIDESAVAAPAALSIPTPYPAVLNQGRLPQCVAYSLDWLKQWQDYRDQGHVWYPFATQTFFTQIGGGPGGAVTRVALASLVKTGYPVTATGNAALHRLAAYYAVPLTRTDVQNAIASFPQNGPLTVALPWFHSWLTPGAGGVLPAPSGGVVGGHQVVFDGYNSVGLVGPNTWGTGWGNHGYFTLPWAYLRYVWEVWRSVDVIDRPTTYGIRIAQGAYVQVANVSGGEIMSWKQPPYHWTGHASSAPCKAPVWLPGHYAGHALVALVTAGVFVNQYVRVGAAAPGVTVVTGV